MCIKWRGGWSSTCASDEPSNVEVLETASIALISVKLDINYVYALELDGFIIICIVNDMVDDPLLGADGGSFDTEILETLDSIIYGVKLGLKDDNVPGSDDGISLCPGIAIVWWTKFYLVILMKCLVQKLLGQLM